MLKSPFIFRGHSDSTWELRPPAWRQDGQKTLSPLADLFRQSVDGQLRQDSEKSPGRDFDSEDTNRFEWALQQVQELFAVKTFHDIVDEQGLEVPLFPKMHFEDDSWYRRIGWMFSFVTYTSVFTRELLELMALAQHHGVPTRLLDWTRDPRIAMFFAADNDTLQPSNDDASHLAVWAVNRQVLKQAHVEILTVPRFSNSFVHAQEALFTYVAPGETLNWFHQYGTWPSLVDLHEKYMYKITHPPLMKFTLPRIEGDKLLTFLQREHITRARLMPTYQSAASTTRTTWKLWRNEFGRFDWELGW